LQFLVEFLPSWQIKTAPSPRCPRQQQNLLAAKIGERMLLAIQIRQREIRRFETGEGRLCFLRTRPKVPDGVLFIRRRRLFNQPCKSAQVEPRGSPFFSDEL